MASKAEPAGAPVATSVEHVFCCAMTAVVLARVRGLMGDAGVTQLLDHAAIDRSAEYLEDVGNWVSFEEAVALLDAGEAITHDRSFARHVGEDGVKVLGGTATATVLRSLGSVEEHLRRLNVSAQRWSTAVELEAVEVRAGHAELRAVAAPGFRRSAQHCDWTIGMLTISTVLFGLPPAQVEHSASGRRCSGLPLPRHLGPHGVGGGRQCAGVDAAPAARLALTAPRGRIRDRRRTDLDR